jgi:hypothetical protein
MYSEYMSRRDIKYRMQFYIIYLNVEMEQQTS